MLSASPSSSRETCWVNAVTSRGLPSTPTTRSMTWLPRSNMMPPRHLEQLLAAHPAQVLVRGLPLRPLAQGRVGLDDADDLVVGRAAVDGEFGGVGVADADLPNLDALLAG